MNKTLTDQQVHDAIKRAEQEVSRMAPFSSMEERRLAFCRALLAAQQPEPRDEVTDDDIAKQLAAAKLDALKLQRSGQMAATMSHNHIVVMQAAWISDMLLEAGRRILPS